MDLIDPSEEDILQEVRNIINKGYKEYVGLCEESCEENESRESLERTIKKMMIEFNEFVGKKE